MELTAGQQHIHYAFKKRCFLPTHPLARKGKKDKFSKSKTFRHKPRQLFGQKRQQTFLLNGESLIGATGFEPAT